jgi:tRNA dimethylallyltransferase
MVEPIPRVVVIGGPTAAGKSSLAVRLAQRTGGEIVNADSMQVYRGMDIGTAKPTKEERGGVPHHLLDLVDPDERFNAALFVAHAVPVIEELYRQGRPCFLVGGSGLYIKALEGGLFECPPNPPGLRERLRGEWGALGGQILHRRLAALDPEAAERIHPNDRVRILRALEVIELTGEPFSRRAERHGFNRQRFKMLKVCLFRDRNELYQRIDHRAVEMMRRGLVEETQRLLERGFGPELKPMNALGYRHAVSYLRGGMGIDEATERLKTDTRRYAKRQLTWFRGDEQWDWRRPGEEGLILDLIGDFYERGA